MIQKGSNFHRSEEAAKPGTPQMVPNEDSHIASTQHEQPHRMPVSGKEYASKYSLTTFINAYYQVRDCMEYAPETVLIVGVGVGLEGTLLREKFARRVTTLDIDGDFGVDYTGSVHNMDMFADQQSDVCIASHILEHMAFRYFETSLAEIARLSKHALIYLPYGGRHMELKFVRAQREKEYQIKWSIPTFRLIDGTKPELYGGEHYWECGYRNFEPRKIRAIIAKYFQVDNMYHNSDWKYSLNFCPTSRRFLGLPVGRERA
jgi:hypothetical protein